MATIAEALDVALQYHQAGRLGEAEQIYRQILAADPEHAEAWRYLGAVCLALGRFDEAAACQQQVQSKLAGRPSEEAVRHARKAQADEANNQAIILARQGRLEEAAAGFQQAIQLNPEHAGARNNLAIILAQCGHLHEAIEHYREALRISPNFYEAWNNLGNALRELGRIGEAITAYEEAVRIKPDYAEAYNNYGIALVYQDRLTEAAAMFRRTVQLNPNYAKARSNLGNVLRDLNQFDEALESYNQALRLQSNYADAYRNRGIIHLLLGNFEQGWQDYEWRWHCQDVPRRAFSQPLWDGSPLAGRTILLHAEQGMGDALQFVRFASLVKERSLQSGSPPGRVVVECQEPLVRLLSTCPGVDQVIARGSTLPDFAVHAPLLSLPAILGTTLATIPAQVPYLTADPVLTENWRQEIAESGQQEAESQTPSCSGSLLTAHRSLLSNAHCLKVGIAWQGNPIHPDDRRRSVALARFAPLAQLKSVQLISLQKGHGVEQLAEVTEQFAIIDLGTKIETFADTAAILKNVDLVITVDSALAHCAGALAVPVWVLVPFAPDWRWLVGREDSPWYPTMRLFRQARAGDWDGVFDRIACELKRLLARVSS